MAKKLCRKCRQPVGPGVRVCPSCGYRFIITTKKKVIPRKAKDTVEKPKRRRRDKTVPETALKICPECQKKVDKKAKFCSGCGLIFYSTLAIPVKPELPEAPDTARGASEKAEEQIPSQRPLKICPDCREKVEPGMKSCPSCGLIFFSTPAQVVRKPETKYVLAHAPAIPRTSPFFRVMLLVLISSGLVFAIVHNAQTRIALGLIHTIVPSNPVEISTIEGDLPVTDQRISLPEPADGIAWKSQEFIIGNKENYLGFLRLTRLRNGYEVRRLPIQSSGDQLGWGIRPLGWNGANIVGYSEVGFFQSSKKYLFTTHDGDSFHMLAQYPAPGPIAALAWDGTGYWVATRTGKDIVESMLYRMDSRFNVVTKLKLADMSCAGVAWDGTYLWTFDSNSNQLFALNVKGAFASTARKFSTDITSSCGIAFDGSRIWVCDSARQSLHRIRGDLTTFEKPAEPLPAEDYSASEEQRNSDSDRYFAEPAYPEADIEISEFSARFIANSIYVSGKLHFGNKLFTAVAAQSSFSKYTITLNSDSLKAPVARVFDALPGENQIENQLIAADLTPGVYHVGILAYVQYRDMNGAPRTVQKTIPGLTVEN